MNWIFLCALVLVLNIGAFVYCMYEVKQMVLTNSIDGVIWNTVFGVMNFICIFWDIYNITLLD